MIDEERKQLARELGALHMQRVLQRIEAAQTELDRGLADLSAILGGGPTWQGGATLSTRLRAYYQRAASLRDRLTSQGGPEVDGAHVDAELRRRAGGR